MTAVPPGYMGTYAVNAFYVGGLQSGHYGGPQVPSGSAFILFQPALNAGNSVEVTFTASATVMGMPPYTISTSTSTTFTVAAAP